MITISVPLTLVILMLIHGKLLLFIPKLLVMMIMLAQPILVAHNKVAFSFIMLFVLPQMLATLQNVFLLQDAFTLILLTPAQKLINA